jgi:L-cystine uptake protein TcyP (sodium:dicarboxylate symporter family)
MNGVNGVHAWMLLAIVGGVLLMVVVVRTAVRTVEQTRRVSRMSGTALRTVLTTAAIAGTQWLLVTHVHDWRVVAVALAVPAFVTAVQLVRALTVTTTEPTFEKGGKR